MTLGVVPPPRDAPKPVQYRFVRDFNLRALLTSIPFLVAVGLSFSSAVWWVLVGVLLVSGALNIAWLDRKARGSRE